MRNERQILMSRGGFTLIEVLIVIAILLAIGGLVVVNLLPAKGKADIDLQRVQLKMIDDAMEQFKLNMNRFPSEEEGLAALSSKEVLSDDNDKSNWRGPYLKDPIVKDKWNHELIYHFPGQLRGEEYYDLISWGPDGQEGGGDDITNHDNRKGADGEIEKDNETFTPASGDSGGGGSGGG